MIFKCFELYPFSGIVFKTFASVFCMFASYFRRTCVVLGSNQLRSKEHSRNYDSKPIEWS